MQLTQSEICEAPNPLHIEKMEGNVRFDDVSFSYIKNRKVIDHVSFDIEAGQTLGIVGHTGAGKSTLANLLIRLYDPEEGKIYIDGVNVKKLAFEDLYQNIAVVSQETYLFIGTILENIRYARPDATYDEVIAAARAGKHIICEKPVALSVSDFDEMVLAAEESGVKFTVHQNRRWDVDYLAIKSLVDSGEIGETVNIESRIHGSRGIPSDWRCHKPQGGGMILDWGVHLIDQMLLLIPDRVVKIYCETTNITTDEVDDGFNLRLTFESGKRATVEVGTYNFISLPRFYMQAREGSAYIEDWQKPFVGVKLKAWCEKDVTPVQTAAGITKTMAPRDELTLDSYEIERPHSDVHDFYRNFALAIDGEAKQLVLSSQVRRVLMVMESAFRSAELGEALKVNI